MRPVIKIIVSLLLTRVCTHGGQCGECLTLTGGRVMLEMKTVQQQTNIILHIWGRREILI